MRKYFSLIAGRYPLGFANAVIVPNSSGIFKKIMTIQAFYPRNSVFKGRMAQIFGKYCALRCKFERFLINLADSQKTGLRSFGD
jgi:hypothetical protein